MVPDGNTLLYDKQVVFIKCETVSIPHYSASIILCFQQKICSNVDRSEGLPTVTSEDAPSCGVVCPHRMTFQCASESFVVPLFLRSRGRKIIT